MSPQKSFAADSSPPVPSWNIEGQSYPSYTILRDDVLDFIKHVKRRIFVVTLDFSDAELASALYTAKVRGASINILLDEGESQGRLGVDELIKQGLFVFRGKVSRLPMEGLTTFVFDDSVWRISARLDDRTPGSVRIDRSPFTADEVAKWFSKKRMLILNSPPPRRKESAKTPTRARHQGIKIFGKMEEKQSKGVSTDTKAIPRRLPHQTRWHQIQSGGAVSESETNAMPGSRHVPSPSSREDDLP